MSEELATSESYTFSDDDGNQTIDLRLLPDVLQPVYDFDGMSAELHLLVAKGLALRANRNLAKQGHPQAIKRLDDNSRWLISKPPDWEDWVASRVSES